MNHVMSRYRPPLGLCPGQPKLRLYSCVVKALRSLNQEVGRQ
jgi:hypothetical protein